MYKALCTCLFLVILGCFAWPVSAEEEGIPKKDELSEYTITVTPYYGPEKLWAKFSPFVEYLRKATGKPWELKLYPTHDATIDAICKGEVSVAIFGPVPLGRSIEKCGVGTVAVAIGMNKTLFYHSVIVTIDPSIASLSQLKGKSIGLFKGSTAAHVVPLKMLSAAGLKKGDINPVFFEGQDKIMNALLNGEVNAAGMKDVLFNRFSDSRLRVLKTSEPLPNFAFATTPKLSSNTKKLIVKTLLGLKPQKNKDHRRLMQDWDDEIKNGFVAPPKSFYSSVMNLLSVYLEVMNAN